MMRMLSLLQPASYRAKIKELLQARKRFNELHEQFKEERREEQAQVRELGGLFIVGTERHESRRIDNQLRGRSGRQGDPGQTQFCISMEDDLMRLFGGDRMQGDRTASWCGRR